MCICELGWIANVIPIWMIFVNLEIASQQYIPSSIALLTASIFGSSLKQTSQACFSFNCTACSTTPLESSARNCFVWEVQPLISMHSQALGPCSSELGDPAIKTISLLPAKMHFSSVLPWLAYQLYSVAVICGHPVFTKCTAIHHSTCAYLT